MTDAPRKRAPRPGEGRPTKYDPSFCERLISLMETEGLSPGAVAGDIGVARSTLEGWVKQYPEFSAAKSIGEAKAQLYWERKLGRVAERGGGPGTATACIFGLKNRAKDDWRDMTDVKHSGDPNSPIVIQRIERVIVDPKDTDA